jgi:hypothetical protein
MQVLTDAEIDARLLSLLSPGMVIAPGLVIAAATQNDEPAPTLDAKLDAALAAPVPAIDIPPPPQRQQHRRCAPSTAKAERTGEERDSAAFSWKELRGPEGGQLDAPRIES